MSEQISNQPGASEPKSEASALVNYRVTEEVSDSVTNTAEHRLLHYKNLATEKTITAGGLDECDVIGCSDFVDIILETPNHDRFCTACIDAAETITNCETVPLNWWKVTGPPEYQLKKNSITFTVRLVTSELHDPASSGALTDQHL
ncbi:hypothetical protein [Mycobacteroides salmoniphilum]|uniref:Uncharacterized protein n=1 Tax=Mycobacteroides salmoniphilum TaxID=404941 RepID=A0A4R8SWJ8_9MYCO|nr:hypothetical protein [Mycobacteroides salmoniphilum]TEA06739.1 hypothetical protein CCUG60884_01877 [Mycobacteroides salmoniphilum]